MTDSFYVPLGDGRWRATVHTTGPWDAGAQHGGPPSALLGRAMQRCQPREDMITARFTCEILRAIPVGEITILARPSRALAGPPCWAPASHGPVVCTVARHRPSPSGT